MRRRKGPADARSVATCGAQSTDLFLLGAGCSTVRPWERENMAKRIMKFAPSPDEDELDLHMLQAREGSAGGYGSAGGGCGCN
jgi:hypothetical protein